MDKLKIISYNARGLKGNNKRAKVINWAKRKKFDIMAIQESHFLEDNRTFWEKDWKGKILSSEGKGNKKGVTLLFAEDLNHKLIREFKDKHGRWIILHMEINDITYTIATYYGPNKDHPYHVQTMIRKLKEIDNNNTIVCGDFNFVFNLKLDKLGGRETTNFKCRKIVTDWIEENDMVDIWRLKNPNARRYTWTSNHKPPIKCRLDFFLISRNIAKNYKHSDIVPGYKSDHSCITLIIENKECNRGRGLWKFNSSLLQDNQFKQEIIETINNTAKENKAAEDCLLWDTLKCCIRGKCIGYAINKKKKQNRETELATNTLRELEEEQSYAIRNDATEEELDVIKEEMLEQQSRIDKQIEDQTRASAIRSKCDWYEQGDKSSKLFLSLEKSRGDNKVIKSLKSIEGEMLTDMEEILKEEERYYKQLYTSKMKNTEEEKRITQKIFNINSPTLEEEEQEELDKEIEEEEIWKIIKDSPKNKSPGTDGFTNEFYQIFWPHLKTYMLKAYKSALERGELSITQKRGMISLIPKPQKDLDLLKNWRPITLLNQDYKYLAKAIANRCKKLLPRIISSDQTGFVPGRYIGCNIQRIQNLIAKCEEENIDGTLLNIDFEKAFDSIEWTFVTKALEHFKFPKKYISWIQCFYNEIETCVTNNGHISKFFKPERGVRQGCPLSPYLFVVAAEVLSLYIKQNPNIDGIIGKSGEQYTVSQFADDTSLGILNTKNNLRETFKALTEFSICSGLKINVEKSEIMLLGNSSRKRIPHIYRNLIKKELKILGLKITNSSKETTEINYQEALEKMKSTIDLWNKRKMSLAGKICIIKTMITSKLVYCMNNLASPNEDYWKEVERILYKFVNDGKPDKIKRNILIGPHECGGYRMLDIGAQNTAVKLNWAKRLINTDGVWKEHTLSKLPLDIKYLLRCNIKYTDLPFKLTKGSLWEEFWIKWCEQNYVDEIKDLETVLNQNIWFNSHIKVNEEIVHYKRWETAGIRWINQLTTETGQNISRFLTKEELETQIKSKIPYLQYYGLIDSIPKSWRKIIIRPEDDEDEDIEDYKLIDQMVDSTSSTKLIYNKIVSGKCELPKQQLNKWRAQLHTLASDSQILSAYSTQRRLIINNKISSFNYKFLMRLVATGRRLLLLGKEDSELCPDCNTIEDIQHLYWSCPNTKRLWERLKPLIEEHLGTQIHSTQENCLLGIGNWKTNKHREEVQLLNIWTKYYIHLNKCNNTKRTTKGLENYIKGNLRTEREISARNGKINLFIDKWEDFNNWCGIT